jgi:hypothetical protein
MLFYALTLIIAHSDMCKRSMAPITESATNILSIANQTKCPTCPYNQITEEVAITKEFDRSSADEVVDELMLTLTNIIKTKSSDTPKCDAPCLSKHKSLPILKIAPKSIHPKIRCGDSFVKTYTINKSFTASDRQVVCRQNLSKEAGDWIEDTLVTPSIPFLRVKATSEGKDLNDKCPKECSYYSTQIFDYSDTASGCSLDLTLIVDCGQPKADAEFIGKGIIRDHLVCTK